MCFKHFTDKFLLIWFKEGSVSSLLHNKSLSVGLVYTHFNFLDLLHWVKSKTFSISGTLALDGKVLAERVGTSKLSTNSSDIWFNSQLVRTEPIVNLMPCTSALYKNTRNIKTTLFSINLLQTGEQPRYFHKFWF